MPTVATLIERLRGRDPEKEQLREIALAERDNADLYLGELRESLRELVPDEIGWQQLIANGHGEFAPAERHRIRALCQLMAVANPMIKRGLALRHVYVHGRGVQIAARATGDSGEQDVNAVVQAFLDDPVNAKVLASEPNEHTLGVDGNLYFALWTKPRTGAVQIRKVPAPEVSEIICNPEDAADVWFYRRDWVETTFDVKTGSQVQAPKIAYYPDVNYRPKARPSAIGSWPVRWDAPITHLKVNAPDGWKFGIPDAFASTSWALAYKTFLENWARLMMSLSRFAWKASAKGSKVAQAAAAIRAAPGINSLGQPMTAGATAVMGPDQSLEAIPKTGATLDSESGRPLAAMVAAGLGVPVTMLLGDPGVTGARATAETLDDPMRLTMEGRRDQWTWLYTTIVNYVIDQSVKAAQGRLTGKASRNEYDREVITLDGDTERTLDITWPDLSKVDPVSMVQAIVQADQTGKIPPLVIARMLLEVLGESDVDEILQELVDDQGNFLSPDIGAGQAAADAFRRGQDPAALLGDAQPPDQPAPAVPA